jgi:glycine reductase
MSDPLEIASFFAREVGVGAATGWHDGRLTLDPAALARAAGGPGLRNVEVHVVQPGEAVRLTRVLDAVEPTVKAADPESTFPGALGPVGRAGVGRSHRVDGVAVLASADLSDLGDFPVSVVDMHGPAAALSPWSKTKNIVLRFDPDPAASLEEVDRSIRRGTLRIARDLAATTIGSEPDHVETVTLEEADPTLPAVCVIVQVASEVPGEDTFVYGGPARDVAPLLLDPRESLDGALTNGWYDTAASGNPTYLYQRSALVRSLIASHGKRLRFAGVVVTLGFLNSVEQKEAVATRAAELAHDAGADGAILTTQGLGNSHTDTMLTFRACERLGIRTSAILAEEGGLTDHLPEADALVSTGNVEEMAPGWLPGDVIGGEITALRVGAYLGAATELGDSKLRAVSG